MCGKRKGYKKIYIYIYIFLLHYFWVMRKYYMRTLYPINYVGL